MLCPGHPCLLAMNPTLAEHAVVLILAGSKAANKAANAVEAASLPVEGVKQASLHSSYTLGSHHRNGNTRGNLM